jgi:O-antigen/teichoic acid export membrane protein
MALTVAIAAIAIALVYLAVVNSPLGERLGGDRAAMALAAGIVIVWPLLRLGRSVLRATGSAVLSQLTQEVPPILKFAAIGAMVLAGFAPTAGQLTGLSLLLYGGCAVWVWWLSARFVRSWPRGGPAPDPRLRLAGLSMMSVLFLQTFTQWFVLAQLSATGTSDEVGVFRVAAQVAGIVATITQTTEFYVAPRMAGDFRAGRHDLAWRRQRRGTVAMLLLSAPVLLVAFLAPSAFLGLLFGPEFVAGATALSIVAFAQLVNALRGPIGAFLSMSGNDHWQLGLTIASVALAVGLGLWLIPAMGVTGAAIAYASAFLLRSIGSAIVAWRLVPRHAAPPAEPPAPDEE